MTKMQKKSEGLGLNSGHMMEYRKLVSGEVLHFAQDRGREKPRVTVGP